MKDNCGFKKCFEKVKILLESLSIGKYQTKLYHQERGYYSTVFGGILTLALVSILSYEIISMIYEGTTQPAYTTTRKVYDEKLFTDYFSFDHLKNNVLKASF